jgi:hypothetical protein
MDISRNELYDFMYHYQHNIRDYTDNIHEYNNIVTFFLNRVANNIDRRNEYYNTYNRYRNPIMTRGTSVFTNPSIRNVVRDFLERRDGEVLLNTIREPQLENVIVRPTAEQIEIATDMVVFSSSMNNHTCPITLETFQEDEEISRIRYCGHTFKRTAIENWFQRNVRCPVCRYDIRDYEHIYSPSSSPLRSSPLRSHDPRRSPDPLRSSPLHSSDPLRSSLPSSVIEPEEDLDGEFQDLVNELEEEARSTFIAPATSITSTLTNAVRTFINNELQRIPVSTAARELLYTFDIPLTIDMSGNYRL